jgi:hypothetical protein
MILNPYEVGMTLALFVDVILVWIIVRIIIHEWQAWRASK